MDLPSFRYHPDPIASGSIAASDATCACCGTQRGFIYTGPTYCEDELEDALCPWCIADGSAAAKYDASFTDPAAFPDAIAPATIEEIAYRTPGFSACWLYTADIHRLPDGDCSTVDLDKVYAAGPDGRFTKLVGRNAAGPNFDGRIDGWRLSSAGYRMCGYMLSRIATTGTGPAWHLELALMRKPKPVLAE